jgi:hypothetical protein
MRFCAVSLHNSLPYIIPLGLNRCAVVKNKNKKLCSFSPSLRGGDQKAYTEGILLTAT